MRRAERYRQPPPGRPPFPETITGEALCRSNAAVMAAAADPLQSRVLNWSMALFLPPSEHYRVVCGGEIAARLGVAVAAEDLE